MNGTHHNQPPQPPYPQQQPGNFAQHENYRGYPGRNQTVDYGYGQPERTNVNGGVQANFDAYGNVHPSASHHPGPQNRPAGPLQPQPGTFGEQVGQGAHQPAASDKYVGPLNPDDLRAPGMTNETVAQLARGLASVAMGESKVLFIPGKGGNRLVTRLNTDDEQGNARYRVEPVPITTPSRPMAPPKSTLSVLPGQQPPVQSSQPAGVEHHFGPQGSKATNETLDQQAAREAQRSTRPIAGAFGPGQPPVPRWDQSAEDDFYADPLNAAQAANGGLVIGEGPRIGSDFEAPEPEVREDQLDLGATTDSAPKTEKAEPIKEKEKKYIKPTVAGGAQVGPAAAAKALKAEPVQKPAPETSQESPVQKAEEDPLAQLVAPEVPEIKTREIQPGHLRKTEHEPIPRPGMGGVMGE